MNHTVRDREEDTSEIQSSVVRLLKEGDDGGWSNQQTTSSSHISFSRTNGKSNLFFFKETNCKA